MKNKRILHLILVFVSVLILISNTATAQSSITIDASQQMTNFVFVNNSGIQDNTYLVFGEENIYKPIYSGAYNIGYSYLFDFGLFLRANAGMRNAGATMVYDATNYQWNFQYIQGKLGVGYALKLGRFSPYLAASGYFGYLAKANQRINNEDFDIINEDVIAPYDYGVYLSPGLRIDASDYISVYSELSYLMGLGNIENSTNGQEANNVAYLLTLGLSFTVR